MCERRKDAENPLPTSAFPEGPEASPAYAAGSIGQRRLRGGRAVEVGWTGEGASRNRLPAPKASVMGSVRGQRPGVHNRPRAAEPGQRPACPASRDPRQQWQGALVSVGRGARPMGTWGGSWPGDCPVVRGQVSRNGASYCGRSIFPCVRGPSRPSDPEPRT